MLRWNRATKQLISHKIYKNNYRSEIMELLRGRVDAFPDYCNFNLPTRNILRRYAKLKATLYLKEPRRITENEEINKFLQENVVNYNETMLEANRLVRVLGDVFLKPIYFRDKMYLEIIVPDKIEELDITLGEINKIKITHEKINETWIYPDYFEIENTETKEKIVGNAGFSKIPLTWIRLNPTSDEIWSINDVMDLVYGALEIGLSEVLDKFNTYLRSFDYKQYTEGAEPNEIDKPIVTISPKEIGTSRIETVPLADKEAKFQKEIREEEIRLMSMYGISRALYMLEILNDNELSLMVDSIVANWDEQVVMMRKAEQSLFRDMLEILNKNQRKNYSLDMKLHVDYNKPAVNEIRRALELKNLNEDIKLGLDSSVNYLMRKDADIRTKKEAEKQILMNIKDKNKITKLQTERNEPTDPQENGLTPQENGQKGGEISQKDGNEPVGNRGNPAVDPAIEEK